MVIQTVNEYLNTGYVATINGADFMWHCRSCVESFCDGRISLAGKVHLGALTSYKCALHDMRYVA